MRPRVLPRVAATILAALAMVAHAVAVSLRLAAQDPSSLQIVAGARTFAAPVTEDDQQGFAQAQVAPDGRTVGWVALTANCCTSYPLPTVLVLWRDGHVVRRIDDAPPIWDWRFSRDGRDVVIRRSPPHGPEVNLYSRVRIADGRVRARFDCAQWDEPTPKRPAWSRVIAQDCPAYVGPDPDQPVSAPAR